MPQETLGEKKKEMPKYSGVLQTNNSNPRMRKKIGRIVVWENTSANPRAPVLYGMISTNYGKSLIALWKFTPKTREDNR